MSGWIELQSSTRITTFWDSLKAISGTQSMSILRKNLLVLSWYNWWRDRIETSRMVALLNGLTLLESLMQKIGLVSVNHLIWTDRKNSIPRNQKIQQDKGRWLSTLVFGNAGSIEREKDWGWCDNWRCQQRNKWWCIIFNDIRCWWQFVTNSG